MRTMALFTSASSSRKGNQVGTPPSPARNATGAPSPFSRTRDASPATVTVRIRGGLLGSQPLDAAALQRLATLPGREVLLSKLAGGMAAPLTGMAGVLAANLRNLVGRGFNQHVIRFEARGLLGWAKGPRRSTGLLAAVSSYFAPKNAWVPVRARRGRIR